MERERDLLFHFEKLGISRVSPHPPPRYRGRKAPWRNIGAEPVSASWAGFREK